MRKLVALLLVFTQSVFAAPKSILVDVFPHSLRKDKTVECQNKDYVTLCLSPRNIDPTLPYELKSVKVQKGMILIKEMNKQKCLSLHDALQIVSENNKIHNLSFISDRIEIVLPICKELSPIVKEETVTLEPSKDVKTSVSEKKPQKKYSIYLGDQEESFYLHSGYFVETNQFLAGFRYHDHNISNRTFLTSDSLNDLLTYDYPFKLSDKLYIGPAVSLSALYEYHVEKELVIKDHYGLSASYQMGNYNLSGLVQYNFNIGKVSLFNAELIKTNSNYGIFFNYVIHHYVRYQEFIPNYYNFGVLFNF